MPSRASLERMPVNVRTSPECQNNELISARGRSCSLFRTRPTGACASVVEETIAPRTPITSLLFITSRRRWCLPVKYGRPNTEVFIWRPRFPSVDHQSSSASIKEQNGSVHLGAVTFEAFPETPPLSSLTRQRGGSRGSLPRGTWLHRRVWL